MNVKPFSDLLWICPDRARSSTMSTGIPQSSAATVGTTQQDMILSSDRHEKRLENQRYR
jgi:hypothetical protein